MADQPAISFSLDALPCAAATADRRLRLTAANARFVERWAALGADPRKLTGSPLACLCAPAARAKFRHALVRHRRGAPRAFSVSIASPPVKVEFAPLGAADAGWLVMLGERAWKAAARRDGSVSAMLTAGVAHDLKTPLQAILGWVSLLRQKPVDARRLDEVLKIVERNTRLQVDMINDLLEATGRPGTGGPLRAARVDLADVVGAACDALRPAADKAQVTLVAPANTGRTIIWGDPHSLTRIASNLIANAIKYSDPGGRVECQVASTAAHARLVVRDAGRGIGQDFVPHVFQAFQREPRVEHVSPDSLGLGLAVVRHLVQMHGGRVDVESAGPGCGATFTVTLPCDRPHVAGAAARARDASLAS
jgi:signal transduction histidine kinase